jgi:hypothetical protein
MQRWPSTRKNRVSRHGRAFEIFPPPSAIRLQLWVPRAFWLKPNLLLPGPDKQAALEASQGWIPEGSPQGQS